MTQPWKRSSDTLSSRGISSPYDSRISAIARNEFIPGPPGLSHVQELSRERFAQLQFDESRFEMAIGGITRHLFRQREPSSSSSRPLTPMTKGG